MSVNAPPRAVNRYYLGNVILITNLDPLTGHGFWQGTAAIEPDVVHFQCLRPDGSVLAQATYTNNPPGGDPTALISKIAGTPGGYQASVQPDHASAAAPYVYKWWSTGAGTAAFKWEFYVDAF